jgi:hypothetical protein
MDVLNAVSLLRRQGLQVDSVTARPSAEPYNRCKLPYPNDIRLLRLLPAISTGEAYEVEQTLVAQMFSGSLTKLKGQYESLSYVWGSEKKPKSITIIFVEPGNEACMFECSITENLWMALTDLRSTSQHRNIWTDALCINQLDVQEKNIQVAQMRDVYTGSKRTVAHLGPRFDGFDSLLAYRDCLWTRYWCVHRPPAPDHEHRGECMLFHLERGIVRVNQSPLVLVLIMMLRLILYFVYRYGFSFYFPMLLAQTLAIGFTAGEVWWELKLMFFENKFFSQQESEVIFTPEEIVYGLTEFFTRSWLCRVWVVQECVVSPGVCFIIGREQFDFAEIAQMLIYMRELKAVAADLGSLGITAFERMCIMRQSRAERQPAPSLATLLEWAWSSGVGQEATNPSDKIFALLGLLGENNPEYFVDYSLDEHEVFWRYARILSRSSEGFKLLEDPRRHDRSSMPSWVPDFAAANSQSLYGATYLYSCSEGLPFHGYQPGPTEKSIEVSAVLLGGIDFVGPQYDSLPEAFSEIHHFFSPRLSIDYLQFL